MPRHSITWLAIFMAIGLMFLRLPPMAAKQDAVVHTYGPLVEVDALAHQHFVETIDNDRLVHGAIRGMLHELDRYSGYISPHELPAFERRTRGGYIGIGVTIGLRLGRIEVVAPIEGSPAARAGVRPGDTILSIDGANAKSLSVFDAEELLVGTVGSVVRLRLGRGDDSEPVALDIVRAPVAIQTIRGWRRESDSSWDFLIDPEYRIGYIRVRNFPKNTRVAFDAALAQLDEDGARGLILDLRFNPGGIMHEAIAMVDRFIDHGMILSTVTRRRSIQEFHATSEGTQRDWALTVLVNGGSASASEIVAGSLQDNKRALIVGERTYGKGSVQQLMYLTEHGAAIKLTIAHYRLPNGRIIHRTPDNVDTNTWGVIPDVLIELTDEEALAIRTARSAIDDPAFIEPIGTEGVRANGFPDLTSTNIDRSADQTTLSVAPHEILRDRQLREALTRMRITLTRD